jgi:hypothetical protein
VVPDDGKPDAPVTTNDIGGFITIADIYTGVLYTGEAAL